MLNQRAQHLRAALPAGFEAALIGTPQNRFYLLDFDAHDAGHLLLLPDKMVYVIDSRYIEAARAAVQNAEVLLEEDAFKQIASLLKGAGARRVYLEDGIAVAEATRLKEKIPDVEFDTSNTLSSAIMALREVKDEEELARMRAAQDITDACFAHILPFIKPGAREIDLALEMEHYMRANGAGGLAFETICVAGPNTSRPHGVPGEYRVQQGDFVTLDFGAKYKGYCADMNPHGGCGGAWRGKTPCVWHCSAGTHGGHCSRQSGVRRQRSGQGGAGVDGVLHQGVGVGVSIDPAVRRGAIPVAAPGENQERQRGREEGDFGHGQSLSKPEESPG